jgi:hypothetical protein
MYSLRGGLLAVRSAPRRGTAAMQALQAKLEAMQARVVLLEAAAAAPAGSANYHDSFTERPPPKSHSTDLVACQRDSMLRTLKTRVVACEQKPKAAAASGGKKNKVRRTASVAPYRRAPQAAERLHSPVHLQGKSKSKAPAEQDLWLVQLEDTVLFPEGGGQPADTGTVGGVAISNVYRTPEGLVLHVAAAPLEVGAEVVVEVDWDRRLDHMQHHSAQVCPEKEPDIFTARSSQGAVPSTSSRR